MKADRQTSAPVPISHMTLGKAFSFLESYQGYGNNQLINLVNISSSSKRGPEKEGL